MTYIIPDRANYVYYTHVPPSPNLTARGMLARPRSYLILDTETTSFTGEVIELAMINLEGETLYHSQFKPTTPIDPAAQAVHGLSLDILANAPRFLDEVSTIRQVLNNAEIHLIYNAPFDIARLNHTCTLYGLNPLALRPLCVMQMNDRAKLGGNHRALFDCHRTLGVLKELARG